MSRELTAGRHYAIWPPTRNISRHGWTGEQFAELARERNSPRYAGEHPGRPPATSGQHEAWTLWAARDPVIPRRAVGLMPAVRRLTGLGGGQAEDLRLDLASGTTARWS